MYFLQTKQKNEFESFEKVNLCHGKVVKENERQSVMKTRL